MAAYAARTPLPSATNGIMSGETRNSWIEPRSTGSMANGSRQFHHIKDIISTARPKSEKGASLNEHLIECENCLSTARNSLDFGRPDIAFRNYLVASEIALNVIPRDKEFGFWQDNNKRWVERYRHARQALKSLDSQMPSVRALIENNNQRYGTVQQANGAHYVSESQTNSVIISNIDRPKSQGSESRSPATEIPGSLRIEKARPASIPKPQQLRGEPLTNSNNDLHARLARLRMSGQNQSNSTVLKMPKASDYQSGARDAPTPYTVITDDAALSPGKPAGPRGMPGTKPPLLPPKLPMAASFSMPKPPSPTYSPSTMQNGFHSDNNRTSLEKRQTYYDQPINSAQSIQLQRTRDEVPYRPRTPNGNNNAIVTKSRSSEIPHSSTIDAETLAIYTKKYNVLLVDIRDRLHFDEGHIFATSIICIEPLSLQEGVSAEALEERLILSPEVELNLFSRMNEFDLVVYYDQSTQDDSYLKGPPTRNKAPHLRAFYDTLYEFNEYKPLKDGRPPALLVGGLDAWISTLR